MTIRSIPTQPFSDQTPGTSGLRKRVSVFRQPRPRLPEHRHALAQPGGAGGLIGERLRRDGANGHRPSMLTRERRRKLPMAERPAQVGRRVRGPHFAYCRVPPDPTVVRDAATIERPVMPMFRTTCSRLLLALGSCVVLAAGCERLSKEPQRNETGD